MTNITDTKTWEEVKEKLRKKFLALIDEDFKFEEGKKNEMLDRVALKAGKTRQELNKIIAFYSKLL
jgi:hypothetical protein